jgi:hypothetical protein
VRCDGGARAAEDARMLLREKRLSTLLQRTALRHDLDRIEAVLAGITTAVSADLPPSSAT